MEIIVNSQIFDVQKIKEKVLITNYDNVTFVLSKSDVQKIKEFIDEGFKEGKVVDDTGQGDTKDEY